MDNYFVEDYLNSKEAKKEETDKIRASKRRTEKDGKLREKAIDLLDKGIGPSEIAEIMELSEGRVKELLGQARIEEFERKISAENGTGIVMSEAEKAAEQRRVRKMEERIIKKRKNGVSEQSKLSTKRTGELVKQRNERIKSLYDLGFSIEEVAQRENLTLDQAKEIYFSLGLSIYTSEQLAELREEEQAKREQEKIERSKAKKRERDRRYRARRKAKKAMEQGDNKPKDTKPEAGNVSNGENESTELTGDAEIPQESEAEAQQESGNPAEEEIKTYKDVVLRMQELIKSRHSGEALGFVQQVLQGESFLTPAQRRNLEVATELIIAKRKEYREKAKKSGEEPEER